MCSVCCRDKTKYIPKSIYIYIQNKKKKYVCPKYKTKYIPRSVFCIKFQNQSCVQFTVEIIINKIRYEKCILY